MDRLNFKRFLIEPWLVEPDSNQISKGDRQVKLEPMTMDVLVYLSRHVGVVISRDELLNVVWADRFVAENTLSRTISRLRKALGDDWQQPRYLETISKTGYRWICPVKILHPGEQPLQAVKTEHVGAAVATETKRRRLTPILFWVALSAAFLFWWRPWRQDEPAGLAQVRPAVTLVGRQANPVISPDGQHIAFSWQGLEGENWDLYVQSVGADNPRRLTTEPGAEVLPAWSPDGLFLAFVAGTNECGIYRVPLTGGPRVKLAECRNNPRHLNWSPDGTRLAFDGRDSAASLQALYWVSIDGGPAARILEPLPESNGDWQPVFSPDGSKLAFLRRLTADLHHVYVYDPEHKAAKRLTNHEVGRIRGLDWMPDGKALVYSYNRDGRFALWRIDLNGDEARRLPITDDWVTYPSLARKVNALIYKNYADVVDLWSLELDDSGVVSGESKRIVPSTRSELHPRLSPIDRRLAFLSNRTGTFEVWSGAGDQLVRHSRLEGLVPGLVDWGPDGLNLVYDARRDGQSDLFLVEASSRVSRPLTETPFNEINARFATTGSLLYYSSDQSGTWQIWEMELTSGSHRQITQEGGFFAQVDPSGKALFFTRLNQPGIFKRDLAGGEEVEIWQGLRLTDWGNWQVCDSGIYFLDRTTQSLMHQPFAGEPRLVYRAPRTFPYLGPAFHVARDERHIVFGQIAQSDDEIMIATFR